MLNESPKLLGVFVSAWWVAVTIWHNKSMEYANNPTPLAVSQLKAWKVRMTRLLVWAQKRWGKKRVSEMIYERQYCKTLS